MSEINPYEKVYLRIEELESQLSQARMEIEQLKSENCPHSLHTQGCVGCWKRNALLLKTKFDLAQKEGTK